MWPFTRREDWEKSQEELDADVRRIAQAGRTDVHNQLVTAESGANLPPGARDLWRSTPPDQRATLGLPPGTKPEVDYVNTRAPGSTVASIPNTPPPGATPTTDISRPPPDMSNRPGGMVAQLLGNANEMKFSRNDNGQIVQVTKHIHDARPPAPISAGISDLQPPAGTTSGPMRIGTPPGSVYDTLLAGGPPGTVKTSLPTGLPPSARNTALNISGPPPNLLASAVQKEKQYNADQAARTEIWNKQMEENRVLPGETQEVARRRRTQEKADQLRREQMASNERIAGEQGKALAARYIAPAEIRAGAVVEGKNIDKESRAYTADQQLEGQKVRAKSFADMTERKIQNQQDVIQLKNELDADKRNGLITLPGGKQLVKTGSLYFTPEDVAKSDFSKPVIDTRAQDAYAQLASAIATEDQKKTPGWLERMFGSSPATSAQPNSAPAAAPATPSQQTYWSESAKRSYKRNQDGTITWL